MSEDPVASLGLLAVDLQDKFLHAMPDRQRLLARCAFTRGAARLMGVRAAATEQIPEKLGPVAERLESELPPETPRFPKSAFSAFGAEGLEAWIDENEFEHVLIMGVETSVCVYQTAIDAMGRELGVTVLSDCVTQRRPEDREPVLAQLRAAEAHVLPSETIFYSLLGSAEHPSFKAFTGLVKQASAEDCQP